MTKDSEPIKGLEPIVLDPSQGPAYRQVANGLRDAIHRGVFPPHTFLPGRRKLAERLAIHEEVIRQATRALIQEGLVQGQREEGRTRMFVMQPEEAIALEDAQSSGDNVKLTGGKYDRIAETLRMFVTKIYPPGRKLPPEPELAEIFRASRPTVRRAVDILVDEGLVQKKITKGTFVSQRPHLPVEPSDTDSGVSIQWPTAEQQEPLYRFTPGQIPEAKKEAILYVREMSRRKIVGITRDGVKRKSSGIMHELQAVGFPREEIERVVATVSSLLNTENIFPISNILFTAQTVIDDARTLRDRGINGDIFTMALRHPAWYYIEPVMIFEKKMQSVRKGRKSENLTREKQAVPTKPLEYMTAGEVIGLLRRAAGISEDLLAQEIPGFNQMTISRIEHNSRDLTTQEVAAIAEELLNHNIAADDPHLRYLRESAPLKQQGDQILPEILGELQGVEVQLEPDNELLEVQIARINLQAAIISGTSTERIAASIGKTIDEVKDFSSGEPLDLSQGSGGKVAPIEAENEELKELYKKVNELRWLRTFKQLQELPRNQRVGRGIKLLRLASQKKQSELGTSAQTVLGCEKGITIPTVNIVKKMLTALSLDLTSKAAQYLFLNTYEEVHHRTTPMTLRELQTCELSELIDYLRRLRGATQDEVGQQIHYGGQQVFKFESGKTMREDTLEAFITWLELDKEKSALAEVLRHKQRKQNQQKTRMSEDVLERVLTERYLFQEHFDRLEPYHLSQSDEEKKQQIESMIAREAPVGEIILGVVIGGDIHLQPYARKAGFSRNVLQRLRSKDAIPSERNLIKIAEAEKYGPHHPNYHLLFNYAEDLRAA